MKPTPALFLFVAAHVFAADPVSRTVIKQEAQRCADALIAGDYDAVAGYTHPRILSRMGGKEAMLQVMKRGTDDMRVNGITILGAKMGNPQEPKTVGTWTVSLLPQQIVMKVPGGKLQQDSHLLGVTEDEGRTWFFIDVGSITKAQFEEVFPELRGKVALPERKKPVFSKD